MKQLYIISTGRCGTKRLKEILETVLPKDEFSVQHQVGPSRLANILGNLMYYFGSWQWLKKLIINTIHRKYANGRPNFISTDPLISMIIPDSLITDEDVMILHVKREQKSFATSFFNLSRIRRMSFIAHNFIPFWQIAIWPLENLFKQHILKKYEKVWRLKNAWFERKYQRNSNYRLIDMNEAFKSQIIQQIIKEHFGISITIGDDLLNVKSNQSS